MLDFITVNTHSSIRIADKKVIYIDPFKKPNAPHDADIILITHSHFDHLSPEDIRRVMKPDTVLVCPKSVTEADGLGLTVQKVNPQEAFEIGGIRFETVPAYNKLKPFHPKAKGWVGYIISSETNGRIYIAGDTDMTEENSRVQCRIAMLPIGGTYTVDAKHAAKLANALRPEFVIPVHYGSVVGKPEDAETFQKYTDSGIQVVLKVQAF
ncbi:MAG: MBL fold metallo-hydrolase [Oscillospiraceae bacterium]|nr:MBL fold metallo-hydrolase [Oscillospiraceae bacterium]